jgi:hypothetical protein
MDKIRQVDQRSAGRLSVGLGITAIVLALAWTIAQMGWGESFWDALLSGPIAALLVGAGATMSGYRQLKGTDPAQ